MIAAQELELKHFRFNIFRTYIGIHIISLIFFSIGVFLATRPQVVNKQYAMNFSGFLEGRATKGFYGPVTFDEILDAQNEDHPLNGYMKRNESIWVRTWVSYDFGSTPHNYCWLKHKKPNYPTLPSFLRLLDFSGSAQVCVRLSVLCAIGVRLFFSTVTGTYLFDLMGKPKALIPIRIFLTLSDIFWQIFAVLVLCLQTDTDKSINFLMPYNLSLFGICFVIHATIYIVYTSMTRHYQAATYLQLVCVFIFFAAFPRFYEGYLPFLEDRGKPCYAGVPVDVALLEYMCISAVLLFFSAQYLETKNLFGIVTLTEAEFNDYLQPNDKYTPWFSTQIKRVPCVKTVA